MISARQKTRTTQRGAWYGFSAGTGIYSSGQMQDPPQDGAYPNARGEIMATREDPTPRRDRLIEMLPESFLAIVPPSSSKPTSADGSYGYTPSMDLLYLTGISQPKTWLVIHRRKGGEVRTDLFIEPYDETHAKWIGSLLTKEEAQELSGIENVSFNTGVRKWIDRIIQRFGVGKIWVDFPVAGVSGAAGSRLRFANELRSAYPHLEFSRLSDLIFRLRVCKDPSEIEMLRKAIDLTRKGFLRALNALEPGMREYEFEAEILYEFMRNGERTPAFPPIVAGGERATCLHYVENNCELEDGTLLLLDFGARCGYYNADISRTVPVGGRYSDRQRELVNMVIEVQTEAIRLLRPGKTHMQWNAEVKEFYSQLLLKKSVIEDTADIDTYYYHNIGHHLGLDTHDENDINMEFTPGMVLTVEPGFYSAEEGIGIRIEDDVLIGEEGNTVLSADIPRSPSEIEAVMAGGI